jgi:hypothetical protein
MAFTEVLPVSLPTVSETVTGFLVPAKEVTGDPPASN